MDNFPQQTEKQPQGTAIVLNSILGYQVNCSEEDFLWIEYDRIVIDNIIISTVDRSNAG